MFLDVVGCIIGLKLSIKLYEIASKYCIITNELSRRGFVVLSCGFVKVHYIYICIGYNTTLTRGL